MGLLLMAWTTKSPIWGNHWVPLGCRDLLGSVNLIASTNIDLISSLKVLCSILPVALFLFHGQHSIPVPMSMIGKGCKIVFFILIQKASCNKHINTSFKKFGRCIRGKTFRHACACLAKLWAKPC
jgi:hypothetical protein